MLGRLPPLNWLRAFEASARHLSFTGAARELNVTQAAVSQKVKALEQHLGCQLFHRLPRSLQLTATGEAYLPAVRDAFITIAEGTEDVFGAGMKGRLTVRAGVTFSERWLGRHLPAFQQAHPEIPVRIQTAVWPVDHEWDDVDLEIRFGNGRWPGVDVLQLTRETFFPLCAREMFDGSAPPADVDALADHTLYHMTGHPKLWAHWLAEAGRGDIDVGRMRGVQVDTWSLAADAAANGGGIMLGFSTLLREQGNKGPLTMPFGPEIEIGDAFHVVTPKGRKIRAEAEIFIDWVGGILS